MATATATATATAQVRADANHLPQLLGVEPCVDRQEDGLRARVADLGRVELHVVRLQAEGRLQHRPCAHVEIARGFHGGHALWEARDRDTNAVVLILCGLGHPVLVFSDGAHDRRDSFHWLAVLDQVPQCTRLAVDSHGTEVNVALDATRQRDGLAAL